MRGRGGGNKTFLVLLGHFLMYANFFSGVTLMKKNIVIKINPFGLYEVTMVSMTTYHVIQKNGGAWGI